MNDHAGVIASAVCRLLGDAANQRPLAVESIPDEEPMRLFCRAHHITTLVSCALRIGGVQRDAFPSLHADADTQAFHQMKADALAQTVVQRLHDASLSPLLLKGTAVQAVYPAGWVRTSTDTDVYIPKEQLCAATQVLCELGFTQVEGHGEQYSFQKPPRYHVELHTSLGGFSACERRVLSRLAQKQDFSVNDHYVYTLYHLYKHFVYAGAGVRMFLDMYCLARAVTDRPYIDRCLKELDLARFDRAVQTVNGILFDGDACEEAMADVIGFIFKSTAFGSSEVYHALTAFNGSVTHRNRWRIWVSDHGFDRDAMRDRYPVLAKQQWLYPFCCLHRVVNGLVYKRSVIRTACAAEHAVDRTRLKRVFRTVGIL